MARKRPTPEEIVAKLRQVIELARRARGDLCRHTFAGVSDGHLHMFPRFESGILGGVTTPMQIISVARTQEVRLAPIVLKKSIVAGC